MKRKRTHERELRLKLEEFYLPRTLFPNKDKEIEAVIRKWLKRHIAGRQR